MSISTILEEIRELFMGHESAPHEEKVLLTFKIVEILVVQLSEVKTAADGLDARMSQIEADIAAFKNKLGAAQAGGLSESDQALVDALGQSINAVNARLDAVHAALTS